MILLHTMANHNFNFKSTITEDEIWEIIRENLKNERNYSHLRLFSDNEEDFLQGIFNFESDYQKNLVEVNKIANNLDIPEEFCDVWLIYNYGDNDFSSYFGDILGELAEDFASSIKSGLKDYAHKIYLDANYNKETLCESVKKQISYNCRFLTDKNHFINTIRYYVAFESARDSNRENSDFKEEFDHILDYFQEEPNDVFIGDTEGAMKFLNKIKFDDDIYEVTPENFQKVWWNGDVSIVRIHYGRITQA